VPIRNSQHDHLLRLIQQLMAVLAQARGLRRSARLDEGLEMLRDAEGELLGPLAVAVRAVDPATAAQLIGDPLRIAGWARILHEEVEILRAGGHSDAADATAERARALAAEARHRAEGPSAVLEELLGPPESSAEI
jgi:hypothetical protein